jgi:ubiquinone/menaquinone biosynthesis C-methylase UbiE
MSKETAMFFDRHAAGWDQSPHRLQRNDAVAAAIARRLALHGDMAALEFGCGTGDLTLRLAPVLGSVLATDVSGGMIEQLTEKLAGGSFPNVTPCQLDILSAPLPDQRFDLIYSSMTLHHVDDVPRLFTRLASVLAPGGHLAVADLCPEDGSFHGDMEVPYWGFSEEQLELFAEGAGMRLDSCEEVFVVEKNGGRYPVFLALFSSR